MFQKSEKKCSFHLYLHDCPIQNFYATVCKRILRRKIIRSKKLYLCKIIMLDMWLYLVYRTLLYFSYLLYIKDDVCVPRVLEINQFFNFLN